MEFLQGQIILSDPHINVVECVLKNNSDTQNSDCTISFHIFLKCGTKFCIVIINKASFLNIVSKSAIAIMNLTSESHLHPFHIPWVM